MAPANKKLKTRIAMPCNGPLDQVGDAYGKPWTQRVRVFGRLKNVVARQGGWAKLRKINSCNRSENRQGQIQRVLVVGWGVDR